MAGDQPRRLPTRCKAPIPAPRSKAACEGLLVPPSRPSSVGAINEGGCNLVHLRTVGAGAVAKHRDDDVFVVWLVGRRHIRNPGEMSEAASMTHAQPGSEPIWLRHFPPVLWLREY